MTQSKILVVAADGPTALDHWVAILVNPAASLLQV